MAEQAALHREQAFPGERLHMSADKTLTEQELLIAAKKGDREAYGVIVKRYMQTAYYIALGFVQNQQDALDVSQDAFIKAFRRIKTYDQSRPFFPWFYRLMRNLCIDHIRRKRRMSEIPLEDVKVLDEQKQDQEMKETLWKGIQELPFDQREVIVLRYFQELSYQEIAELTGKPLGSVMSALFYAKKKLKIIVSRYMTYE